jgi:hypothetical protein
MDHTSKIKTTNEQNKTTITQKEKQEYMEIGIRWQPLERLDTGICRANSQQQGYTGLLAQRNPDNKHKNANSQAKF